MDDKNNAKMLVEAMTQPRYVAEYWHKIGLLDDTEWQLYQFYWRNSAPHFSDLSERYELR